MADYFFSYQKRKKEFGKHCNFEDFESKLLGSVDTVDAIRNEYIIKNPNNVVLDNIPEMSEHTVNTERVVTVNKGMKHLEGGWPKEIDPSENQDTNKWRKRLDKDPGFGAAVKFLGQVNERSILQNNTIDIFEEYFLGQTVDHSTENLSTKTLMLFKDQTEEKRAVSKISWHPDGPNKLAVAYSILRFQQMPDRMPVQSYIWDVNNPNSPDRELLPQSPLCTVVYNHKNPDTLVGGCYNGLIAFWDLRRPGSNPYETSVIEKSHHDPVYDIFWLHSKTGFECVSASTDGRLLWWDTRRLGEPTDTLLLTDGIPNPNSKNQEKVLGGTSLEYNPEAGPTKYLVGTEQGVVLSVNKKPKKAIEINQRFGGEVGKHHGPIYSIQRNPANMKYFLTIGDWTARIWMEDLKTPIMTTKYHASYLTDGCWSPTRPGVFFVTRMDGWLDVWDYFYRQNEVAFSHKVGDAALSSISVQAGPGQGVGGKLVAVGDAEGTVTLLELCDSLHIPQSNEKISIAQMFDRETKRERNLEQAKKAQEAKRKEREKDGAGNRGEGDGRLEETLRKVEEEFFSEINENGGPSQESRPDEEEASEPAASS
eukprot:GILJ01001309.1.p1 GENE.GILJ01001309.1~~GILJ01001309.1.p1  ORF type:complete len:593 (-),score=99.77 GILJ01001309.1:140-1918(-)